MIDAVQDIVCRLECQSLRESSDIDTISLRTPSPRVVAPKSTRLVQGMVQHVVIHAIPEPSESTPLERILEFRNDPEAKAKLHALRRWMAKVAKTQIPSREIADELEWLLHEYEAYMRVSRMKFKKGILETVITVTAKIAEDLLKFRWAHLTKLPFTISAQKIDLLEAELRAPGREIAYIAHARSEFDKP